MTVVHCGRLPHAGRASTQGVPARTRASRCAAWRRARRAAPRSRRTSPAGRGVRTASCATRSSADASTSSTSTSCRSSGGPGVLGYGDAVKLYTTTSTGSSARCTCSSVQPRALRASRTACAARSRSGGRRSSGATARSSSAALARRPLPLAEPLHASSAPRARLHRADAPPAVLPAAADPATGLTRRGEAVLPLRRPPRAAEGRPGPDRRLPRLPRRRPRDRGGGDVGSELRRQAEGLEHVRFLGRVHPSELGRCTPAPCAPRSVDRLRGVRHRHSRGFRAADAGDRARARGADGGDRGNGRRLAYRTTEELVAAMDRLRRRRAPRAAGRPRPRRVAAALEGGRPLAGYFAAIEDARGLAGDRGRPHLPRDRAGPGAALPRARGLPRARRRYRRRGAAALTVSELAAAFGPANARASRRHHVRRRLRKRRSTPRPCSPSEGCGDGLLRRRPPRRLNDWPAQPGRRRARARLAYGARRAGRAGFEIGAHGLRARAATTTAAAETAARELRRRTRSRSRRRPCASLRIRTAPSPAEAARLSPRTTPPARRPSPRSSRATCCPAADRRPLSTSARLLPRCSKVRRGAYLPSAGSRRAGTASLQGLRVSKGQIDAHGAGAWC